MSPSVTWPWVLCSTRVPSGEGGRSARDAAWAKPGTAKWAFLLTTEESSPHISHLVIVLSDFFWYLLLMNNYGLDIKSMIKYC